MIYLTSIPVIVFGLVLVALSGDGTPRHSLTTTAILAGVLIAAVRLGLFWGALTLYSNPDHGQFAGHVVLVVNSLPELAIAAALSGHPGSPALVALLIALTSAAFGWLLAWIRIQ